ncbi:MAG: hypothetical protein U0I22_07800 [Treponema sp.]|nr:hypothetical protein [Treponema sp.]
MKIKHSISILFMILLLASCKDGLTIFDQIDQETKLEDAVITGSVNSIVRSGDTLYASDGNIYSKDVNAVRGWSKIASPSGTIIKLAADSDGVFALYQSRELYFLSHQVTPSTWTKVDTSSVAGEIQIIFWNGNATDPQAYLHSKKNTSDKFYELSGTTTQLQETSDITSTVILTRADVTYTANGKTITGKSEAAPDLDLGSVTLSGTIYSLTFSEAESSIYAGTSDGLKKIPVDDNATGEILGVVLDPRGNWGATISDSQAFAVLATGYAPENAALYTSTIKGGPAYAKINGLWGYYYNRRNNWNRE